MKKLYKAWNAIGATTKPRRRIQLRVGDISVVTLNDDGCGDAAMTVVGVE